MTEKTVYDYEMKVAMLQDENATLKKALRDALNFAQETALRGGSLGGDDPLGNLRSFLEETISRGMRLNEAYRGLIDGSR